VGHQKSPIRVNSQSYMDGVEVTDDVAVKSCIDVGELAKCLGCHLDQQIVVAQIEPELLGQAYLEPFT